MLIALRQVDTANTSPGRSITTPAPPDYRDGSQSFPQGWSHPNRGEIAMTHPVRLLTAAEVLNLTGYKSRTTLWRRVKAG